MGRLADWQMRLAAGSSLPSPLVCGRRIGGEPNGRSDSSGSVCWETVIVTALAPAAVLATVAIGVVGVDDGCVTVAFAFS